MPKFLLLARDSSRWLDLVEELGSEEFEEILARYQAWDERVAKEGSRITGEKLRDDEGRVLSAGDGGLVVTDGPHAVTKEVIAGFWVLEAGAYDEVVDLARDHPHLDFGSLEVRQIEEL